MQTADQSVITVNRFQVESHLLERAVTVDCFATALPGQGSPELLFLNDGQSMEELGLAAMLEELACTQAIKPLICIAIHAGDRLMEYGTASVLDYLGRGYKAAAYSRFIFEELLPLICTKYQLEPGIKKSFAGFSLGALSALDIAWSHPRSFRSVGVFSGSLWWRKIGLDDGYVEDTDRIMHALVRAGEFAPWLKFFFETGAHDETMDRNHNGIIDSIDDTLGLIDELVAKGYNLTTDIRYLELPEGRHDIATWAVGMRAYLVWMWGTEEFKV